MTIINREMKQIIILLSALFLCSTLLLGCITALKRAKQYDQNGEPQNQNKTG